MAVKIKLKRLGKIRNPQYRIIVADARAKRDGRAIEEIGIYHPKEEPSLIRVDSDRVQYWLGVGAQPTDPVRVLLKVTGDWQKFTGEGDPAGTLRVAEPKANKLDAFAKAVEEGAKVKAADTKKTKRAAAEAKAPSQAPAEESTDVPADTPAEVSADSAESEVTADAQTEEAPAAAEEPAADSDSAEGSK